MTEEGIDGGTVFGHVLSLAVPRFVPRRKNWVGELITHAWGFCLDRL